MPLYVQALYTKVNGPKKRKVFSEGVLVVETVGANQKVMLESETGKCEGKKTLYGHHTLGQGSEIVIGNYSVEVGVPKVKKALTDDDAIPCPGEDFINDSPKICLRLYS